MYVAGVWTKTAKGYFKMSRNKSFDVRARFGAIYGASKTKKYLLKNSTTGNRLLFSELGNIEFTCPENSNWRLFLPDSNVFLKFQNNFTAEFWATFSYGLMLQRFFWNFSGISISLACVSSETHICNAFFAPPGGGVVPYIGHIGICRAKGYGQGHPASIFEKCLFGRQFKI